MKASIRNLYSKTSSSSLQFVTLEKGFYFFKKLFPFWYLLIANRCLLFSVVN